MNKLKGNHSRKEKKKLIEVGAPFASLSNQMRNQPRMQLIRYAVKALHKKDCKTYFVISQIDEENCP